MSDRVTIIDELKRVREKAVDKDTRDVIDEAILIIEALRLAAKEPA